MLQRFRRKRKDPGEVANRGRKQQDSTLSEQIEQDKPSKITFFDLPGETRNDIYELAAQDLALRLIPHTPGTQKRRASWKTTIPVPGLLLASRQVRRESMPILLSTAPVEVRVTNFDFRNLMRAVSSFYRVELKALRSNDNLTIRLTFRNSGKERDYVADLRRWAVQRADSLDRLPWTYIYNFPETPREWCMPLKSLCDNLPALQSKVEESVQWELQTIVHLIEEPLMEAIIRASEPIRCFAGT